MSWHQRVVWSEGLFLQPQHFQQHDRFVEHQIDASRRMLSPWAWGWADLALDEVALGLGKIALLRGRGLLPDGTLFHFPDEAPCPPALDVPADAKDQAIYLGVPLARPGAQALEIEGGSGREVFRFDLSDARIGDETRNSPEQADVQLAAPALRFILERDLTDAHAAIGVARVVERRADNKVELDRAYIPPLLHCAASGLATGFVQEILALLHQRGEALAARMLRPGKGGVAEVADFLLLQTVNRWQPVFAHLSQAQVLHAERLFAAMVMLAGDLSAFRDSRRPVDFPDYIHDDLRACLRPVMDEIRQALSMVMEQNAIAIPLHDRKYGVRVASISDLELLKSANFVLAVNAELPGEALRSRFPQHTKIGPVERIRDLVNLQLPGIGLTGLPVAPRQIPYHAGFSYYELDRGNDLWKQLERTGNLAMHIAGEFPGLELEFWAIRGN